MGMAGSHRMGKKRTADAIAAEIEATCLNLTSNVSSLEKYVKPANLAAKSMGSAGAFFLDKDGEIRMERVVAVSSAVIAFVGLVTRSRKN
jgi:hypothetical protein